MYSLPDSMVGRAWITDTGSGGGLWSGPGAGMGHRRRPPALSCRDDLRRGTNVARWPEKDVL